MGNWKGRRWGDSLRHSRREEGSKSWWGSWR